MMKVAFVSRNLLNARRGAQSAGWDWFRHISLKQTDIFQIVPVIPRTRKMNIFGGTLIDNIHWMVSSTLALHKMCKMINFDLVHIHAYGGNVTIPPRGIPTVVTFHDEPIIRSLNYRSAGIPGIINWILTILEEPFRLLLRSRSIWIHALSNTIRRQLEHLGTPKNKIRVIPNSCSPVDISNAISRNDLLDKLDLPVDAKIVLTVGNITARKALHRLIDVAEKYHELDSKLYFLAAGRFGNILDKSYARQILLDIKRRGIDNLRLLGYVSDELLAALWKNSSLYISVSMSEACNLALLEAANEGLPIVSTNVGSAQDLFSEGQIVSRNPTTEEIIQSIEKAKGIGRMEYKCLNTMDWSHLVERIMKYYEDIVKIAK